MPFLLAGFLMSGTPFSSASRPPYAQRIVTRLLTWSPSWPIAIAKVNIWGGFWIFGPISMTFSQVSKNWPLLAGPMMSERHWGGQTSMAYGAAITAPSPNVWELMAMSYMPPALSLNLLTRSFRSASSPWLYQYVA